MLCFKIHNTDIRITFTFLFANIVLRFVLPSKICFLLYIALFIHEVGHIIAINISGARIKGFVLSSSGIRINCKNIAATRISTFFIASSGCLANIITALLFQSNLIFFRISLIIAAYSLIPLNGFDGYDIINCFFEFSKPFKFVVQFLYYIILFAIIICFLSDNQMIISAFCYIVLLSVFCEN